MIQGIFFGEKSSCCKSGEGQSDLNATSANVSKCCSISSSPTIEEIREKAYLLWESAGCPQGDGTDFWIEAEKQLLS